MPTIKILTDCKDSNAELRQLLRYGSFFPNANIQLLGLKKEIEVAGTFLDAFDSIRFGSEPHIFIGNIAPRGDKKYKNGVPFCFSRVGNNIIIGTPASFSILIKFGIVEDVYETDVYEVCKNFLPKKEARRIADSQFRSFEYLPLLALWLFESREIPSKKISINKSEFDNKIWLSDCFGNAKTTLTLDDLKDYKKGSFVTTNFGRLRFYKKLADVPRGVEAMVVGSSGFGSIRFIELVKQKGDISANLKLSSGISVLE